MGTKRGVPGRPNLPEKGPKGPFSVKFGSLLDLWCWKRAQNGPIGQNRVKIGSKRSKMFKKGQNTVKRGQNRVKIGTQQGQK